MMGVMDANNKKLFLTDIAKEKNIDDHKDVLSSLMPHDIIYADLDNVDLLIERDEFATAEFTPSGFTSIKIKEAYLQIILRKDCWSGKTMLSSIDEVGQYIEHILGKDRLERVLHVTSNDHMSISIEDLFVYEHDFLRIEQELNIIETEPKQPTTKKALPLPLIKNRVSTSGLDKAQVQYTCQENPEAVNYIKARRSQGATLEEIASELGKAGGSYGVIGCLMKPECADVTQAREHGKYLLKKSKKL